MKPFPPRRLMACLVGVASCLMLTAMARAATVYNSLASFTANSRPGLFTNTFTRAAGGSLDTTLSFSGAGFSYAITSSTLVYSDGDIVGASAESDDVTIAFTSGNVTAIGGNFFQTDIEGIFQATPITVNLSDGTSVIRTPSTVNEYLGFTSPIPITSLTMKSNGRVGNYATLDNLSVGQTLVVPETGSLVFALFALPVLGNIVVCRRRSGIDPLSTISSDQCVEDDNVQDF